MSNDQVVITEAASGDKSGESDSVRVELVQGSKFESTSVDVDPRILDLALASTSSQSTDLHLVELAHQIQTADRFVKSSAIGKLGVIAEQIRFLQNQAKDILEEASTSTKLHHAACNFKKVPGTTYSLYERPSGQTYFSMLSPEDWGSGKPCDHKFLGSYRLEFDMSWTPLHRAEQRKAEIESLGFLVDRHVRSGDKNVQQPLSITDLA